MDDRRSNLYISQMSGLLPHVSAKPQRSDRPSAPVFELYGEERRWPTPDLIHVESIAARSSLHDWEIKPHRHHGLLQLLWLCEGAGRCILDDRRGRLSAGSVVIVPQHCVHGFRFANDAEGLVLTIAYPLLARLEGALAREVMAMADAQVLALTGDEAAAIERLLLVLAAEFEAQCRHRSLVLESLTVSVLASLMRIAEATAPVASPGRAQVYLAKFSAEVERRFREHLPLSHYAGMLGISAAHLNALCRQHAGHSALDLIHARQGLEARRHLLHTDMTVREIADLLGFADPAYFTRFFRRLTGLSPREFRKQAGMVGAIR